MGTFIFIVIVVIIVGLMIAGRRYDNQRLCEAPRGSTRVQTVKETKVNGVVNRYTKYGWQVAQQSTAKSFGSKARVTITFQKG